MKRCDQCRSAFDSQAWHPAALDDTTRTVREFCSESCKRAYFERESDESSAGGSGEAAD